MEYAPAWVCKALADFHPHVRLGWDGEIEEFAVLQLYHNRDAKRTFRTFWDGQGPAFSASGRPGYKDWDDHQRRAVYLQSVSPRDVFSGKVVRLVKSWARPFAAEYKETVDRQRSDIDCYIESMAHDMGTRLYKKGQGTQGGDAPILAKKFIEKPLSQRRMERGELTTDNLWRTCAPPGGFNKHIEADQGDPNDLGEI